MGTLYLVGTPIGNLEDVTLRALRVLREVSVIAAEDTRITRKLLTHYDIHTPLTSFHDFSGPGKVRRLVERLTDGDVALVSDAGMPGLSDPGYPLVAAALAQGAAVTTLQIEGVLHEFSSIAGVVEDATDIILNLKQVPFRLHGEGSKTLRLLIDKLKLQLPAQPPPKITAAAAA